MYLKNYTSSVHPDVTIARIERCLINAGATGVQKLFDGKHCRAIIFEAEFAPGKPIRIRIPANIEQCLEALWKDYSKSVVRPRKTKDDFMDQAASTAWKLAQDWVEVQISLVMLKQVEFLQAFMQYVWDGKQTFYERVKDRGFKAMLPEKTD